MLDESACLLRVPWPSIIAEAMWQWSVTMKGACPDSHPPWEIAASLLATFGCSQHGDLAGGTITVPVSRALSVEIRGLEGLALLTQSRVLPMVGSKHCRGSRGPEVLRPSPAVQSLVIMGTVLGLFLAGTPAISVTENNPQLYYEVTHTT